MKNDLFNWGQLLTIVSDFIIVCSFILLCFMLLSIGLNSYPFIMTYSISQTNARRFFPVTTNYTVLYCWIIHFLSILIALTCFSVGIMGRMLKQKRRIEFAFKSQKFSIINAAVFNICFVLILIFGNFYIDEVEVSLKDC